MRGNYTAGLPSGECGLQQELLAFLMQKVSDVLSLPKQIAFGVPVLNIDDCKNAIPVAHMVYKTSCSSNYGTMQQKIWQAPEMVQMPNLWIW